MKILHKGDYRKARAAAYPRVEDQLDSLWHAMDSGSMPKAEPFYTLVKEVKSRYPKPQDNGDIE